MNTRRPLSLRLYSFATALAEPLASGLLAGRVRRGKEDPARLGERLGRASLGRPQGPLIWLHGVSVGESLSLLPLIAALKAAQPQLTLLVTSGTRTSAELLSKRLPAGVLHQYAPVDGPRATRRFINHWRPDVGVFVESEIWPNLLLAARDSGTRLALLSAKLSDSTFRRWSRLPGAARAMFAAFDLILAQDDRAAARLTTLGATVPGLADLKYGADPLPADEARLAELGGQIAARPVILAASTHPGEDELMLDAFRAAKGREKALLVIVPRHPMRGPAIAQTATDAGFHTGLQSAGAAPDTAEVFVADVLGELGLWFRLASLSAVGGSLVPGVGGHNPLEPARLGRPFVSGPFVDNWLSTYAALVLAEATQLVAPDALSETLAGAIANPRSFAAMAERAQAYVAGRDADARHVAGRVLELLP